MRNQTLIAIALTCSNAAIAQQTVTLKSPKDSFTVNVTATAIVTKDGPFLKVHIDKHTMWASKKYARTNKVLSYSIGISAYNSAGKWDIKRTSTDVASALTIKPGETEQIPPRTLLIPVDGISNLADHRLTLKMRIEAPEAHGGLGYTYAHSENLKIQ